jgi:serine/threonine protein kinase
MPERTVDSFPTYGDLTMTQGWARDAAQPIEYEDTAQLAFGSSRYTEGVLLGAGGMGKVLLARDARIGREVALKQLHADRELTPDQRARFLREARVQGQLEHPSIVPVYDIETRADGTTFFTMRRVIGRTLHAILEDRRAGATRYTQRELLTAFATVCLAIDYAHSRGVVHRDLKPANIMLGDFGEVYVLDWGLARLLDESDTAAGGEAGRLSVTGELMGTPLYMAPEQMTDPGVGPAADVFALGAILFEILTLERLRDPKALYVPADARPSVRSSRANVPPELETVCVTSTQTDPDARYRSARELQEAIARYLEGDRDKAQRQRIGRQRYDSAMAVAGGDERKRTIALRELGLAIAMDPMNEEYARAFSQIWSAPPRETPEPVKQQMAAAEQALVRNGTRNSVVASATWFLFLPLVWWMGIRRWDEVAYIMIPNVIAIVLAAYATWRSRVIPMAIQLGIVISTLVGMTAISRSFGSLVLTPLMISVFVIVMQAHPARWFRRACWIAGTIALVTPALLEFAGVLPASYVFADGRMQILPQAHELPATGSAIMLIAAYVASMLVPGIFIGRLRVALTEAQEELQRKEWHYKRLGGELIATAGEV